MAGATCSTPPPSSNLCTPSTPRLGYDDDYEPYAHSRRKSSRVASQRLRATQTPPPPPASGYNLRTLHSSPPSTIKKAVSIANTFTPPSTISKKRSTKTATATGTGYLGDDLTSFTAFASSSTFFSPRKAARSPQGFQSSMATKNEMLPTPDRTPHKRPDTKTSTISSIARNLFPVRHETVEQAMPSPKKHKKKYGGFGLASLGEDDEEHIEIFTDSKDRIPEVDLSSDNPFYAAQTHANANGESSKRVSKRRKIGSRLAHDVNEDLEDADRKDGMVYVFRGKKVFRRFSDLEESGSVEVNDELDDELDATVPARLRGPLTRSSMKPRLLFPAAEPVVSKKADFTEADEEADTDIEEGNGTVAYADGTDKIGTTPRAPRYAPVSPPATAARASRSKKLSSDIDMASSSFSSGKESPSVFDSWQRTKPKGQKRHGDALTSPGEDHHKRLRGRAV